MCGIYCRLRKIQKHLKSLPILIDDLTKVLLTNRGPNAHTEVTIETDQFNILFLGFVLWQQGTQICIQPHSFKQHILLINGDIFNKRDDYSVSDTEWLAQQIEKCNDNESELLTVFRSLEGPYSIFYYNQKTRNLYFVRDVLGRQSLLLAINYDGDIILSSVLGVSKQNFSKCIELPPIGIFQINFDKDEISLHPWQLLSDSNWEQLTNLQSLIQKDIKMNSSIESPWLVKHTDNPHEYNLELILKDHIKNSSNEIFEHLTNDKNCLSVCVEIISKLEKSVKSRVSATPSSCRECLKLKNHNCHHAKIGILFSGGIDCTILAVLADKLLDLSHPIDLINVSFEKVKRSTKNTPIDYNTPDRLTARESLEELKRINPKRKWNLIEVDVTRMELDEALKTRISHLVYPLNTILDESIGAVLWFGGRGVGKVDGVDYSSNCRVLLIGSGADELFGGYTRHRNAFLRQYEGVQMTPYERLEHELEFDFSRLPSRNLSRDDRVIGDHGVTARSPYLEEKFVCFVRSLKSYQKCYHALEQGVGDKLLLRFCGFQLGLRNATSLKKRAMQFGSRVADHKQNAKDLSKTLLQILDLSN